MVGGVALFTRLPLLLLVMVTVVTALVDSTEATFPSATNGKIAFVSNRDGNFEVYVMNPDGSGQTNVTNNPAHDDGPAWSPDGSKIAFARLQSENWEIYVMNADGSGQTNVTNHPAADDQPAWSADGSKIAYRHFVQADLNPDVYVMNANGSGQTNLTNNPAFDDMPAWSPDGSKIAFRRQDAGFRIWVMNADGSAAAPLADAQSGDNFTPDWSPDGSKIAFASLRAPSGVYVMNANGSGVTRLSDHGSGFPRWQQGNCAAGDWDCDGIPGIAEGQCGDAIDNDSNGLINDGCPQVGATAETGGQCANASDDDGDSWVNDGCPGASETLACGANTLSPSSTPERTDRPGDDDLDGQTNEPLPPGSEPYDCDGDGFAGNIEMAVFAAANTAQDQDPCGTNAWPPDIFGTSNVVDIQDLNAIVPKLFQSSGGANARYNLFVDGSVDIQDLNAVVPYLFRSCVP